MLEGKKVWGVLLGIVLLGGVLRLYQLGENSFVADEFLDINSAYGYHQTGEWRAWDFNFGAPSEVNENIARDERAVIYKWQVAQLFKFLPPTETTARLTSVLWGIFSILVVYWSAWIFTRRRDISVVAAILSAVSISAIIMSRRLRMYAMFFPVYLGAATALYAAYEHAYAGKIAFFKSLSQRFGIHLPYLGLGAVLSGVALLTHQLGGHLFIVFGLYVLWQAVLQYRKTKEWKNRYGYTVAAGLTGVIVAVIFVPQAIRMFTNGLVFFDDHFGYLNHALADFATPVIGALLIGIGIARLLRTTEERSAVRYLILAYFVPLLMAIFLWRRNVGPQYIYFIQSFGMILAGAGLVALSDFARTTFVSSWGRRAVLALGLGLALVTLNVGYFFEKNNTYHETSTGGNPNYRKVFTYVKKEKQVGDVLITRNFRNYYWSGAAVAVYDFGGELSKEKLSLATVQAIERAHPSGWFIYTSNDEDYIAADVERYAEKNWERVSNANVRGDITVFRFGTRP